jgi:single-strand DNA-binding protein
MISKSMATKAINQIVVVGRVGQDPELRYFESGSCIANFSIAVNRPTKNKETDWFNIKIWGRQAEIAGEYVKKGSLLAIEGELDFEIWTDKNNQQQTKSIISAKNMRMLGSKADNSQSQF